MGIGTITLWRAKRQVEANLITVKNARARERMAFEGAFGINDMITVPLIHEATAAGICDESRRLQSYQQLIGFYDRIAKTFAPDDHQLEVVAKATRRAGALRIAIDDRRGCDDYARAIDLYEAMSDKVPAAIWYRTDLISTLREYASCPRGTWRSPSGNGSPPSSIRDRRWVTCRQRHQAPLLSQGSDPGVQRPRRDVVRTAPLLTPPTERLPIV